MTLMLNLNGAWRLEGFDSGAGSGAEAVDFDDSDWTAVQVPGDVHRALVAARRLPEPFDDLNEDACRWVEDKEWWYRLTFGCPADLSGPAELVFEGLDTFATLWLNGHELGRTSNMHVAHTFDVAGVLRPGQPNVIAVRFDPTCATAEQHPAEHLWSAFYSHRMWVRKAQMNFGWDWGPRLVTVGLWRGVRLQPKRSPRLRSPYVRCHALSGEGATVVVGAEVEGEAQGDLMVRVTFDHAGEAFTALAQVCAERAATRLVIPNPQLWWPHTHGVPTLHEVRFELLRGEEVLDGTTVRTGLRTMEVVQAPDRNGPGRSFTVHVNGVPVFCKGADWLPVDSFIGSAPTERYRALVAMARDAHMNMLRIWGGGVYEHDAFYDACDELGVMVWQDFMFACAGYPDDDPDFRAAVEAEAEFVVRRLRNRPCLALWCGNNENDWIEDMIKATDPGAPFYGRRLYHEVLPAVCARLDPTRLYWPSSPYGGNDHNSELEGDRHNWKVWAGIAVPRRFGQQLPGGTTPEDVSFRHYAADRTRFCSEFGIHGSPVLRTLTRHVTAGELEYDSPEFLHRIKDPDKTRKDRMMAAHVGMPNGLQDYAVKSALVQAEGLRFGLEHYRRSMFHCSGALFWQLHDCWPGISWSCIDYYLNPKAGYYYVRRALAPVILSPVIVGDHVQLWGVNDRLERQHGEAVVEQVTVDGEVVDSRSVEVNILPNSAEQLAVWRLSELPVLTAQEPGCLLIRAPEAPEIPENVLFARELKDIPFRPATIEAVWSEAAPGEYSVTLSADVLAYFVHLEFPVDGTVASDNYVPVIPDRPTTIRFSSSAPVSAAEVRIAALNPRH
jgi:beta-mannosidase